MRRFTKTKRLYANVHELSDADLESGNWLPWRTSPGKVWLRQAGISRDDSDIVERWSDNLLLPAVKLRLMGGGVIAEPTPPGSVRMEL